MTQDELADAIWQLQPNDIDGALAIYQGAVAAGLVDQGVLMRLLRMQDDMQPLLDAIAAMNRGE